MLPPCSPPDYAAHRERATKRARCAGGAGDEAGSGSDGAAAAVGGGGASGEAQPMAVDSPAAAAEGQLTANREPAAEAAQEKGQAEPPVVSYAAYYAERWGQAALSPDQPLLVAAQVSRQQLARGLDLHRSRKRPYALPACEGEGGCCGCGG